MTMVQKLLVFYSQAYLYVKALHIMVVIFLMAGMLYLPRLFVYHLQENSPQTDALFQKMEKRLMRCIIHPAWAMVILTGSFLLIAPLSNLFRYGWEAVSDMIWLFIKLSCVLMLIVYYGFCIVWQRDIAQHRCTHTPRFFRAINEIPAILVMIIVFMVVVKPWE